MPRRNQPSKIPSYRHNKATNRAVVTISGKDFWLGSYESPESHRRYDALIAEWISNGRRLPRADDEPITIAEVMASYFDHVASYYVDGDGQPTSEQSTIRGALRHLRKLYEDLPAVDFGPMQFKAVRQRMIESGWCRNHINKQCSRLKSMFRWATENELVEPSIYHALQAVRGLAKGRSPAPDHEAIKPVPTEHIQAIRRHVSRQVWALIQLQLLTGARAGELVMMRPIDLDTSGRIWTYKPHQHKTAHHGHQRTIYLGPQAQGLLKPFLRRAVEAYMFSPSEAEAERRAIQHQKRVTPLHYGNRPGTNRKRKPNRKPRDRYDVSSYRRAIQRACDRGEVPHWHPHQLRHNAATNLRREHGIEAARVILGHRSAAITDVYAELDEARAMEVIARVG